MNVQQLSHHMCDAVLLLAGQWTCNSQVAVQAVDGQWMHSGLGQATYYLHAFVTKQYNLILVKGQFCVTEPL